MKDTITVILFAVCMLLMAWFLLRELSRARERHELAEKNMSFLESINLTGLPIITFHNNGHPVNMVLDTGSNVCLINREVLPSLKYEIGDTHTGVIGVAGDTEGGDTVFLPLVYKDWEFDFECLAADLTEAVNSMKKEYGVTIHGLLGTGFFSKYKYILDFSSMVAYPLKKD